MPNVLLHIPTQNIFKIVLLILHRYSRIFNKYIDIFTLPRNFSGLFKKKNHLKPIMLRSAHNLKQN